MKKFFLICSAVFLAVFTTFSAQAVTETFRSGHNRVTVSGDRAFGVFGGTNIGCQYMGQQGSQYKWSCNSDDYQLVLENHDNEQVAVLGLFYNRMGKYVSTMEVPYTQIKTVR